MKSSIKRLLRWSASSHSFQNCVRPLTKRALIPNRIWQRLPVEQVFTVDLDNSASFRYKSSYSDSQGRALFWRGADGFEPETIRWFLDAVAKATCFLDVGAHTGHFSLVACARNPSVKVWAFEPVPRLYSCLTENIRLNDWQERCQVIASAVGEEDGEISLHVPSVAFPSSASRHPEGFRNKTGESIGVKLTRLDNFFRDKLPPDLIKVDVEGFEDLVFSGMEGLFAQGLRPVILFECHYDGPVERISGILGRHGYKFLHLRNDGSHPVERLSPQPNGRLYNWVAMPS